MPLFHLNIAKIKTNDFVINTDFRHFHYNTKTTASTKNRKNIKQEIFGDRAQISAANGEAVVPIAVAGRIDIAGAVEVEVVGVAAVRVRRRRPVVAVVAGAVE